MNQLAASLATTPTDFWNDRPSPALAPELLVLGLRRIGERCHGYANGCGCEDCQQRREALCVGTLRYDPQGRLVPPDAAPTPRQPWEPIPFDRAA